MTETPDQQASGDEDRLVDWNALAEARATVQAEADKLAEAAKLKAASLETDGQPEAAAAWLEFTDLLGDVEEAVIALRNKREDDEPFVPPDEED